jgi:large subunit ribosomal protein L24
MQKIKRDDEVIVIAGKDKGKRGKVRKYSTTPCPRVRCEHDQEAHRPNPQAGVQGGIVEREAPIQVSNVAIFNPATSKADRVGFRVEDGKKCGFTSPAAKQSTRRQRKQV